MECETNLRNGSFDIFIIEAVISTLHFLLPMRRRDFCYRNERTAKEQTQFYRISGDLDKTNKSKIDKSEDTRSVGNHLVADLCQSDPLTILGSRYKIKSTEKVEEN